jgi:hypothetical protein
MILYPCFVVGGRAVAVAVVVLLWGAAVAAFSAAGVSAAAAGVSAAAAGVSAAAADVSDAAFPPFNSAIRHREARG